MTRSKANRSTRRSRRRRFMRSGATAVEMALVSPFIFLLVFASMEFCRVVMIQQALTNAAREGCRTATLSTTQNHSDCEDKARNYLKNCFADYDDPDVVRVSVSPSSMDGVVSGTEITTQIEVNFSDVSWLPAQWVGDSTLVGTASMKRE